MEQKDFTQSGESDSFSSALNNILSNPEMMSMISSMAGRLKDSQAQPSGNGASEEASAPIKESEAKSASASTPLADLSSKLPDMLSTLAPLLSGSQAPPSKKENDRECLLRALKPYLSEGRSEAIDYIIKFSKLSELLKHLS